VNEATFMNGAAIMQCLFQCIQYKGCLWRAGNMNRPQFAGGSKVSIDGAYGKK
jgi:hypothetical protein